MKHLLPSLLAALLCGALAPALAQDGQRHAPPPPPPPEAFTACQGKTEGDAVTIALPDGKTLDGTCRTIPTSSGSALAAMPNGHPGGHRPPPPPMS